MFKKERTGNGLFFYPPVGGASEFQKWNLIAPPTTKGDGDDFARKKGSRPGDQRG